MINQKLLLTVFLAITASDCVLQNAEKVKLESIKQSPNSSSSSYFVSLLLKNKNSFCLIFYIFLLKISKFFKDEHVNYFSNETIEAVFWIQLSDKLDSFFRFDYFFTVAKIGVVVGIFLQENWNISLVKPH